MWGSLYISTTENLTQMKDLINLMRQELFISTTNALFLFNVMQGVRLFADFDVDERLSKFDETRIIHKHN